MINVFVTNIKGYKVWPGSDIKWMCSIILLLASLHITGQNPGWIQPVSSSFNYSANVITYIKFNGIRSNNPDDKIALFVGNELRGLSKSVSIGNNQYLHFITVYSNIGMEFMNIRIYHRSTNKIYEVLSPFRFKVQSIYGSVDTPNIMNIYTDNNAPLGISSVPLQQTIQGLAFEPIDMADYLVQPDPYDVTWSYVPNPNLVANFDGSILHVQGVPGFTGQTQLMVRATELNTGTMATHSGPSLRNTPATGQIAETAITFNITELYAAPAWHPIPDQGIVLGGQFTPVNLHDYEYQFGGPAILYDYYPIVVEQIPAESKPVWQMSDFFITNMSSTLRLDYTPKYQFHHADDILAAFINNEVRGVATLDTASGLYYLTTGGYINSGDSITLKFYSGAMKKIFTAKDKLVFKPYAIEGSFDDPLVIEFAPMKPVIPEGPIPGGFALMPVVIIDSSFTGTVRFEFSAADALYPKYLNAVTQTSFCVAADSMDLIIQYFDADGDGLGDPAVSIFACSVVPGYVTNNSDCNDNGASAPAIELTAAETSGTAPNDNKICSGSPVNITATGGDSYLWSTGQMGAVISVNPAMTGSFTVTATLTSGCSNSKSVNIFVEGTVVKNQDNAGDGSLRSVLECIAENGIITYDLPLINSTILTSPLIVNKNVSIHGTISLRPEIQVDFNQATHGIEIQSNKILTLKNVDLISLQSNHNVLIMGPGNLTISEQTKIRSN